MGQNKYKNEKNKLLTGFTLVEMLVVLAIISLLSSIVFVGVQGFRAKARDSRRISDLNQIRTALVMYNTTYGNWIEAVVPACSGQNWCGYGSSGTGNGYFNLTNGGAYLKSTVRCLIDPGFLSAEIIDPSGGRSGAGSYFYMKYTCTESGSGQRVTYIYARLETGPSGDLSTFTGTCCTNCDTSYGMNYYLKVQ